jgi:hypothetical protein
VLGVGSQAHKDWGWATEYVAPQQWLAESVDLGGQQDDGVGCTIEWLGIVLVQYLGASIMRAMFATR